MINVLTVGSASCANLRQFSKDSHFLSIFQFSLLSIDVRITEKYWMFAGSSRQIMIAQQPAHSNLRKEAKVQLHLESCSNSLILTYVELFCRCHRGQPFALSAQANKQVCNIQKTVLFKRVVICFAVVFPRIMLACSV